MQLLQQLASQDEKAVSADEVTKKDAMVWLSKESFAISNRQSFRSYLLSCKKCLIIRNVYSGACCRVVTEFEVTGQCPKFTTSCSWEVECSKSQSR